LRLPSGIIVNTGESLQLNAWTFTLSLIRYPTSSSLRLFNSSLQNLQHTELFSSINKVFWHRGQNTSLLSTYVDKHSTSSCKIFSYSCSIHCSILIQNDNHLIIILLQAAN
jgi:hypothetical protein